MNLPCITIHMPSSQSSSPFTIPLWIFISFIYSRVKHNSKIVNYPQIKTHTYACSIKCTTVHTDFYFSPIFYVDHSNVNACVWEIFAFFLQYLVKSRKHLNVCEMFVQRKEREWKKKLILLKAQCNGWVCSQ